MTSPNSNFLDAAFIRQTDCCFDCKQSCYIYIRRNFQRTAQHSEYRRLQNGYHSLASPHTPHMFDLRSFIFAPFRSNYADTSLTATFIQYYRYHPANTFEDNYNVPRHMPMYARCLHNVEPRDTSGSLSGGDEQPGHRQATNLALQNKQPPSLKTSGTTLPTQRHMQQMRRRCKRC
jgi:hypothetical protein